MRRVALILGILIGAGGVAAVAGVVSVTGSAPNESQVIRQTGAETGMVLPAQTEDGVHGGPIERFHDPATCDLVDVSTLPGNWTHGDYVTAVGALGDPDLVRDAARSPCGKPMLSMRGGPPPHAPQREKPEHPQGKGKAPTAPDEG